MRSLTLEPISSPHFLQKLIFDPHASRSSHTYRIVQRTVSTKNRLTKNMSHRQSRRVRGMSPEMEIFTDRCFFCLTSFDINNFTSSTCQLLQCCKKLVHNSCQNIWLRGNSECAHCRAEIDRGNIVIWNPAPLPQRAVAREAIRLYRVSEIAFTSRGGPNVSNHVFGKISNN